MLDRLLAFNSSRYRLEQENIEFAKTIPKGSLVLDAGCGDAPYRNLFKDMRYESADFAQSDRKYAEQITYVCDLKAIPVENNHFDYIICNQVLEHIPEPQKVIDELYRVLKPGGKIIFTAPLFYQEHEQPYDFYRYTQFGWRFLLERAGFKIERIDWMEGFFGLSAYMFGMVYHNLPTRTHEGRRGIKGHFLSAFLFLTKYLLAVQSIIFHRLEMRIKIRVNTGAKNYVVIAAKPKTKARGAKKR